MGHDIKDVAKKANVSISTVSRVLNKSGYISKETTRKVQEAVKELGYRQNNVARSLRRRKTTFFGLVVPDISNEFYSTLAKTIEKQLSKEGFQLFLCNTEENEEKEKLIIDSFIDNLVSGIIVVSSGVDLNRKLLNSGIPTVMVDRNDESNDFQNVSFVEGDNYNGAFIATETLIEKNAKKIVFLRTNRPVIAMREREKGFLDALEKHNFTDNDYRIFSVNISSQEAMTEVKEIYRVFDFDSIFCAADILAIGALKGLHELNISVPEQIQLIGFDGISLGHFLTPDLSTIKQDIDMMGKTIAENLIKMNRNQCVDRHVTIPVEYIERGSTRNNS